MTTSAELRLLAVAALRGTTDAGQNVFAALDYPTWDGSYPILYLHTPSEDKESLGRQGGPQFTVTLTLQVSGRVEVENLQDQTGVAEATVKLEALQRQIELALINNPDLMSQLQQFPFIRTEMKTDGTGDHNLGEIVMSIGLEFYQGPEDFFPIPAEPLEGITVVVDSTNVYDPTGTYVDPMFPDAATPAPRTEGPDGRAEGGLEINFPT
ncbi:hypothetical protein L2Y96_17995 [Luteibacter aegosomaticola]|uniref:hypothetical protein n=1 Tax=Luteibacter aegosomaticola TaxID=2911538 RepID=UPI001FFBED9F|nr:hypothetical protein [Luteibacter aegosomaticola]UPG89271.1 hypothetical protein L2Y96_17995 [Luteibacter aegosomaticola]